ncbi:STAS/SEC14 domain-containing protein [Stappia sp. GBMRC 2046]|uniref:STAS/SEC14 domain-containing protein n=1 Tax=Stappia sediminis TaxID=2692190 RepID=A0A7X3S9Z0_9HYPH|nr:STAS/SEC14 domain-containing protein [Stappia sediminis]MXN67393.1 STAS/SEC14 domain-containing protein [Stappia sediminis]
MIEQLQGFPESVAAFACHGHVTRDDYLKTLVPAVEQAFSKHEKVRLYYEIGPDFKNVDAGAVWTDFATGVKHWMRWERIAVVTDVEWIRNTMWAFGFLMPGEIRLFPIAERDAAREWIAAE